MHQLSMDPNAVLRHAVESGAGDMQLNVAQQPS
jgi:hypothetical protein